MSTSAKTVAVIGLGYVGLPLALLADKKGYDVIGIDLDKEKVRLINEKKAPIIETFITENIKNSKVKAQTLPNEPNQLSDADIILICVPTPVIGRTPNLKPLKGAAESIAPHLKKGALVVVESTINPGVCDDVVIPILEAASGGRDGTDFYVAHCPERVSPGDSEWTVANINRVVGSNSKKGLDLALELYNHIIDADIKPMATIKEAEAVKVVENSFRDVNIAFVNELAMSFHRMGINVENVIDGAATKPFAFMPHRPGVGVGGHCIPVDPYYLIEYARGYGFDHDFLSLARRINSHMPEFTTEILQTALNEAGLPMNGTKVAVLGLAYKPNVDDDRESPAYELIEHIDSHKADVTTFDPYVPQNSRAKSLDEALKDAKAVVIATAHKEFVSLKPADFKKRGVKVVVDGRNAFRGQREAFEKAGIVYQGIGA